MQLNVIIDHKYLGKFEILKLPKLISFIIETTKDPYFLLLLNTVTCLLYSEQQDSEKNTIKSNYSV